MYLFNLYWYSEIAKIPWKINGYKRNMKQIKKVKFPPTPRVLGHIGKYIVGISKDEKQIYFWDGKSTTFNFYYMTDPT